MKAITVRQPWAWAFFHAIPVKDVENRTRQTKHRGPLIIHSSARCPPAEYQAAAREIRRITGRSPPPLEELPLGQVLGTVDVLECVRDSTSRWAQPGLVHWMVRNPRACKPFPARGKLALFEINSPVLESSHD